MATALWRVPLDEARIRTSRGEVHVLREQCKGCGFCVEYCPRDVLELSRAFNAKGYHPPEVRRSGACVKCDQCQMVCPEFAIFASEVGS